MNMNLVDKNLTDLILDIIFLLIYHICIQEKTVSDHFGRNDVHFPNIILRVCERTCVFVSSLAVIFGFSGATRFVFCKKMIPEY